MLNRRQRHARQVLLAWSVLGLAALALLPWYFPQNVSLWRSLSGVSAGAEETASGLVQAARLGRPWLWSALGGLALALAAWHMPPGRAQGWTLIAGAPRAWRSRRC